MDTENLYISLEYILIDVLYCCETEQDLDIIGFYNRYCNNFFESI